MTDEKPLPVKIWNRNLGSEILSVSASSNGSLVAAGTKSNEMVGLAKGGTIEWRKKVKGFVLGVAVSPDSYAAVGISLDKSVICVSNTGVDRYSIVLDAYPMCVSTSNSAEHTIVGLGGGGIVALNHFGKIEWKAELDSEIIGVAIEKEGRKSLALSQNGELAIFDKKGTEIIKKKLGTSLSLATNSEFKVVYVALLNATIKMFSIEDHGDFGEVKAKGAITSINAGNEDGRVIIAFTSGKIDHFDVNGDIIWTINGGEPAVSISADSKAAFIIAGSKTGVLTSYILSSSSKTKVMFEIYCQGKCGSFASSKYRSRCPSCGSDEIAVSFFDEVVELKPEEW